MRPGGCDGQKRTDSMEDRISDLNAQFTFMIYESISRSLFQVCLLSHFEPWYIKCLLNHNSYMISTQQYFLNKFPGPRSYIFFHPLRRSFARKRRN